MIDLAIKNTDESSGFKRGVHYLPFTMMSDSGAIGLTKRSDGTTNAEGILYPSGVNNNSNIGAIGNFINNITGLHAYLGYDDGMYSSAQLKVKVGEQWFSKYKRLIYTRLMTGMKSRQRITNFQVDNSCGPYKVVVLDSTRSMIIYRDWNIGVVGRVIKKDSNNNIIATGTAVSFVSNNNWMYPDNVDACLINTDKVAVIVGPQSRAVAVCSVNDMTITMGASTTIYSGSSTTVDNCTISKLDTDKFIVTTHESNGNSYVRVVTVSGVTISGSGTGVSLGTSSTAMVLADTTTTALVLYVDNTNTLQARVVSISGTTATLNSSYPIGAIGETCTHRVNFTKIATGKFMTVTDGSSDGTARRKLQVITISGTVITATLNMLTNPIQQYAWGGMVEITTNTLFNFYNFSGDGTNFVRQLIISGTTVTEGSNEQMTNDGSWMYQAFAVAWDNAIMVFAMGSSNSEIDAWFLAPGATTYELYNDATLIGSFTDTFSYVEKTYQINGSINAKRLFLGIKNTSGATRWITLLGLMAEVR